MKKEIEVLLGEQELSEQLCLWTFLKVERVVPALKKLWRLFLHQGTRKESGLLCLNRQLYQAALM